MADKNKEQTAADKLREELCYAPTQAAKTLSEEEIAKADAYCEEYKAFIDAAKTEREAVETAIREAEKAGFVPFDRTAALKPGELAEQAFECLHVTRDPVARRIGDTRRRHLLDLERRQRRHGGSLVRSPDETARQHGDQQ